MLKRKAQEEMIGFVLIIVLVSVIALIFLAISIRKPVKMQESKDIENFLHSSLLYTTSCKPSEEIVYDFKDLVKACYQNEFCLDGNNSCNVLKNTAFELIENGFQLNKVKGYVFKIYNGNETLVSLNKGNLTGEKSGSQVLIPVSGENLYVRLEFYY